MNELKQYADSHEEVFEGLFDSVVSKTSFFSIILIVVMILTGLLETFYVKQQVFDKKKI
jgi:hypothetical protein